MPIYVNQEGYNPINSPTPLTDDNLVEVPELPLDIWHRWDFVSESWVKDLSSQATIDRSDENIMSLVSLLEQDSVTVAQMRSQNILLFKDFSKLSSSNQVSDWDRADIIYYRSANPKGKNDGIYTTSRGYLAFPRLAWDQTNETKTTSFVFFMDADSRYFLFGLASKERFNFNSNDYKQVEIGLRFRNSYGCYYQHGLVPTYSSTKEADSTAYVGYRNLGRNNYYRLDIPDNGARGAIADLYLLANSEPSNWLGGELIDSYPLINPPDRKGINLFPVVTDYLGSKHQLLGVFTN